MRETIEAQWPVSKYGKGKQGLELKKFGSTLELRKFAKPAWAVDVDSGQYITELSRKKDGAVYIPTDHLAAGDDCIVAIERAYALVEVVEITEHQVRIKSWGITPQEMADIRKTKHVEKIKREE